MTTRLIVILLVKAAFMVGVILFSPINLGPDEAQYWTWSQLLSFGYYSKPPGIAWLIYLGTKLFGSTEIGVRCMSVCLSFSEALLIYYLAQTTSLSQRISFWCAILFAFSPIGFLSSLLATTDVGFVLFWTLSCTCVTLALKAHKAPNPILLGLSVMMGALFKWPMYLFWIFYFIFRHFYFPFQKATQAVFSVLISLLAIIPSVIWNAEHNFPTFRHVLTATLQGGPSSKAPANALEFLGAQFLLLSPILFGLLIAALWIILKKWKETPPSLKFCCVVTLSLILFGTLLSLRQKVQGNWIIFAYPTAMILIGFLASLPYASKKVFTLIKIAFYSNCILISLAVLLSWASVNPHFSLWTPPFRYNPLKQNLGWTHLTLALEKVGYDPQTQFLVSDSYQVTSEISFYAPGKKRAYFLNLDGRRNNQFVYWPTLFEEQQGKSGYFIYEGHAPYFEREWEERILFYTKVLPQTFEKVTFIEKAPLVSRGGKIENGILIFYCENPKNVIPKISSIY